MVRLNPFVERRSEFRESNLGKVLVFCEGQTETNYFEHFSNIIRNSQNKYAHLEIV